MPRTLSVTALLCLAMFRRVCLTIIPLTKVFSAKKVFLPLGDENGLFQDRQILMKANLV